MRPDIQRRGFTLIELLVVIGIIALLVSILLPTFSRARDLMRSAQTGARLQELDSGAQLYFNDHRYYPGQQAYYYGDDGLLPTTPGEAGDEDGYRAGSQVLAASLFAGLDVTQNDLGFDDGAAQVAERYAPISVSSGQIDFAVGGREMVTNRPGTLLDTFPEPKPILYFPARLGVQPENAYNVHANSAYLTNDEVARFADFIRDDRMGGAARPYRPDSFLLIAPGIDREYFTADDNVNFNR